MYKKSAKLTSHWQHKINWASLMEQGKFNSCAIFIAFLFDLLFRIYPILIDEIKLLKKKAQEEINIISS